MLLYVFLQENYSLNARKILRLSKFSICGQKFAIFDQIYTFWPFWPVTSKFYYETFQFFVWKLFLYVFLQESYILYAGKILRWPKFGHLWPESGHLLAKFGHFWPKLTFFNQNSFDSLRGTNHTLILFFLKTGLTPLFIQTSYF